MTLCQCSVRAGTSERQALSLARVASFARHLGQESSDPLLNGLGRIHVDRLVHRPTGHTGRCCGERGRVGQCTRRCHGVVLGREDRGVAAGAGTVATTHANAAHEHSASSRRGDSRHSAREVRHCGRECQHRVRNPQGARSRARPRDRASRSIAIARYIYITFIYGDRRVKQMRF